MGKPITPLDGQNLSFAALVAVAKGEALVAITPASRERLLQARAVVLQHFTDAIPVYGLTTGLGPKVTEKIEIEVAAAFSRQTIAGRSQGVGQRLDWLTARMAMVARLHGFCFGVSGVSPAIADAMVEFINHGLAPAIPQIGSIGESDLCLMGHMAKALLGEGELITPEGSLIAAGPILAKLGLHPPEIGPKDGLALVSASSIAIAQAVAGFQALARWQQQAEQIAMMSFEAFRGNISPLLPIAQQWHALPQQAATAARLLAYLDGSDLADGTAAPRRLQDPLSIRCMGPAFACLAHAMACAEPVITAELNSSGDNPGIDITTGKIWSNANFHTGHLTLACDQLAIALVQIASMAVARMEKLLDNTLTDLPGALTNGGAMAAGYAPLMKTAQAALAEIILAAQPAAAIPQFTSSRIEDVMSFSLQAASKLRRSIDHYGWIVSAEALIAAEALELRNPARSSDSAQAMLATVRSAAPAMHHQDRSFSADITALYQQLSL